MRTEFYQRIKPGIVCFITLLTISIMVCVSATAQTEGDNLDYIAIVNDEKITVEDFNRNVEMIKNRYAELGYVPEGSQLDELKQNVLNNLVEKELLFQESKNNGIEIDSTAIDTEFETIKNSFPSVSEFENKLHETGYTVDFLRDEIHANLAIQQLLEKQIGTKADVSEEEIKTFFDANRENYGSPEEIRARHILIEAGSGGKEKIESIQKEIQAGGDFQKLANDHSTCPSGKNGGDLGFFGRGQMVEPFEIAAFALEVGEISEIVETPFGYHLIKLDDRRPEELLSFDDVKDNIEQELRRRNVASQIEPYIASLKQNYTIEINQPDTK